jgi:hypothetical protein
MRLVLQRGARWVNPVLGWLRAWPWFLGSILLGLLIKENFPFSHWPMYSNFTPSSGYVYVINGEGEPVATATFFETAPRLRRQFDREWKAGLRSRNRSSRSDADIEREAATHVLKRVARRLSPEERAAAGRLGFVRATLEMDVNREINVSERTVAQIEFDGIPYTPPPRGAALKERH